ncbi:CLIP domain-containing serine protease 14D-like isoform X2 [Thrips palmi]|nr:CLIP domain-containing serine protease 14D-like isoform X2 [Thrips palmi]
MAASSTSSSLQTTSDSPVALALTLRPGTAPALVWPPASSSHSSEASEASEPAVAIPLLPPVNAPQPPAPTVPPAPVSSQIAQRSGGPRQDAADADVWFPESPSPPSSAHRPPTAYNRPSEDAAKRPGDFRPHGLFTTTTRRGQDAAADSTRRPLRRPGWPHWQHDNLGDKRVPDSLGDGMATNSRLHLHVEADDEATSKMRPSDATPSVPSRTGWGANQFDGRSTTAQWGTPQPKRTVSRTPRVSERKCAEFARLQTERVVALPLVPDPKPSVQHVQKCDTNSVPLVVGGSDARLNEFPHMVAIGYRGPAPSSRIEWNCGGSLISELFVLTAAHCTATAQGPPIRVRLAEHNLESNEDGARPVDVAVSSMVRHPGYQPPARYHDIGLLRLARKVPFGATVRPACLYTEDEDTFASEPLVATGWGHTEQLGERSQVLQKVILNFVDQRTCSSLYSADSTTSSLSKGIVADSQICAGVLEGGRDTCQGDSGGPLQVTSHNNQCVFHIVGITSFGKVCAARNSPGVYTRVSKYIPWIERHVWPEER